MTARYCWFAALAALLPSSLWADAAHTTVIAVITPGACVTAPCGGYTTGVIEANAVSWTQSIAFADVSVSAFLGAGFTDGTAWLTNRLGIGTTAANILATTHFHTAPGPQVWVTLFQHMHLGPGTYYLVLSSTTTEGTWVATDSPLTTTATGVVSNFQYAITNSSPGFSAGFPLDFDWGKVPLVGAFFNYAVTGVPRD